MKKILAVMFLLCAVCAQDKSGSNVIDVIYAHSIDYDSKTPTLWAYIIIDKDTGVEYIIVYSVKGMTMYPRLGKTRQIGQDK